MSPFSKGETSPFVVLKWELQHERYGAGGAPTTNEPKRANKTGSNPARKAQDAQTTTSSGAVVALGAAGKTSVPGFTVPCLSIFSRGVQWLGGFVSSHVVQ